MNIATRILVIGGAKLSDQLECLYTSELIEASASASSSSILRSVPFSTLSAARRGACVVARPGADKQLQEIIVIGGFDGSMHLASIEMLKVSRQGEKHPELASVAWQKYHVSLAEGRSCAMACFLGDNSSLCVLGGWDGVRCLDSVQKLNLDSTESDAASTELPCMIAPVKNGYAVWDCVSGSIHILGGWDGRRTLATVFAYEAQNGHMTFEHQLPYSVECHACVKRGNFVYIVGGFNGLNVCNSVVAYNVVLKTSCILKNAVLHVARECHDCVLSEDEKYLFVIGGWNGKEALRSVEVFEFVDSDEQLKHLGIFEDVLSVGRNRCCCIRIE